jgi:hypothetical protein
MSEINQPIKSEDVDLWKALAEQIAESLFKSGLIPQHNSLKKIIGEKVEKVIKEFAEDRIIRVYQKVSLE